MNYYNDKTILITGASSGIGEAFALTLDKLGAKLILTARSKDKLADMASQMNNAISIPGDLSKKEFAKSLYDQIKDKKIEVDIVINNAGTISPIQSLKDISVDDWNYVIDVNLKGVFYAIKLAIPSMLQNGGGTFLTLSSGAAHNLSLIHI